ncbi:MAG TPA: hypothetical protein VGA61_09580 [Anaerolineae bacterium]
MALVRCYKHGNPVGRTNQYVMHVRPLGYPETAALCGRRGCAEPGLVWLTVEEEFAYLKGERVFDLPVAAIKVRVEGEDQ